MSTVCRGAVGTVTDPAGTAKNVLSTTARAATDQINTWLVNGVAGAGEKLIDGLDRLLGSATSPHLDAAWFVSNYDLVLGIAVVVAAVTFLIQIFSSLIRREPGMLTRAVAGSAVGVIGGFAILSLCQVALSATDALCTGLLHASGSGSLGASLSHMWGSSVTQMSPGAWLLAVLLGLLFIIAAVMLWVAMFLREISIYVLAVFAPIAFAGYGWDRTRAWLRRWGEIVAALIFSKLVIYIVFILGVAMMAQAGTGSGTAANITQLLGGACLLFLAALAPWATHRFISFAGAAAGDVHEHASPKGAAGAGATIGMTGAMAVGRTIGGGVVGGPAGAAAGAGQGTSSVGSASSDAAGPTDTGGGSGSSDGGGGSSPSGGNGSSGGGGSAPNPSSSPPGSSEGGSTGDTGGDSPAGGLTGGSAAGSSGSGSPTGVSGGGGSAAAGTSSGAVAVF